MKFSKPWIGKLHVSGFRSIEKLSLDLEPVTLLIGPNGSGKSNLIDAVIFIADSVRDGLQNAIGARDGISVLRRQNPGGRGKPVDVRLEIAFYQSNGGKRRRAMGYGFTLGARAGGDWFVKEEWFSESGTLKFHRKERKVVVGKRLPPLPEDRLALPLYNNSTARSLGRLLETTTRYDVQTEALRRPQPFAKAEKLQPGLENLYHIWKVLEDQHPKTAARIVALLGQVLPGLRSLHAHPVSRFMVLQVKMGSPVSQSPNATTLPGDDDKLIAIDGAGLSDGTLRAFALLVAVYQPRLQTLVAVEEPEIALHPYAAGLLFQALLSAPRRPQLLMSTHSPFILDSGEVELDMLRVVRMDAGRTVAGPIAPEQIQEIQDHLATGAELLAENSLVPAPPKTARTLRPAASARS